MKSVHLVIPDLFLPEDFVAEVCAGLFLPALEKIIGRGASTGSARTDGLNFSLENLLCEMFGIPCQNDAKIAPISATFDGLGAGCWLRADPVHLRLQRDQMLLLPGGEINAQEATQMCASLNEYFAGQGMEFFAPHPQRWYLRVDRLPRIHTRPLSQVIGGDVRGALPTGEEAARWHQVFNEIQMLLFSHPLNESREARGVVTINSLWLWGGGCDIHGTLQKNYDSVISDDVLPEMFATAAGIPFVMWPKNWRVIEIPNNGAANNHRQLLVWAGLRTALQSGDLTAWRSALQDFENNYAQPLWQALRSGKIARLQLDILGRNNIRRVQLTRGDTWAVWRRAKPLSEYSSK
jgi:hypothetical protein